MKYNMKSPRVALGEAMVALGGKYQDVLVLDPDVRPTSSIDEFCKRFPDKFIQSGIAEQNLIGVAAGLSTIGFVPFFIGFGMFASQRVADQLYTSVGYTNANVKIVGTYSGFCAVKNGVTHQPIADLGFLRAIPGFTIIEPGDATEVVMAVNAAYEHKGPVYLRLGRDPLPVVFDEKHIFEIGKGYQLVDGKDLTLVSTGVMLSYTLSAREKLLKEGIESRVLHIPTIKPIDREILVKAAAETGALVTVENHNILGGFGSAVAEVICEEYPVPLVRCGISDEYGESGQFDELIEKYGFGVSGIIEKSKEVLKKKKK